MGEKYENLLYEKGRFVVIDEWQHVLCRINRCVAVLRILFKSISHTTSTVKLCLRLPFHCWRCWCYVKYHPGVSCCEPIGFGHRQIALCNHGTHHSTDVIQCQRIQWKMMICCCAVESWLNHRYPSIEGMTCCGEVSSLLSSFGDSIETLFICALQRGHFNGRFGGQFGRRYWQTSHLFCWIVCHFFC